MPVDSIYDKGLISPQLLCPPIITYCNSALDWAKGEIAVHEQCQLIGGAPGSSLLLVDFPSYIPIKNKYK